MSASDAMEELARALVRELIESGRSVAAAESCTGGWIAKSITDVPGASRCFAYGIVSYSNGAKEALLGVSPHTLEQFGAVSEPTVKEMAEGVIKLSGADLAVAVSGIAGPDGGSAEKPVGTVWFAWAGRQKRDTRLQTRLHRFDGDRLAVRQKAVVVALQGLRELL
ncbi:MAG TPA: CinA family protein [Woeseiaceae bacterium]|nr:CinA family protein [Woeseiaceae bacterium]